MSGTKSGSIKAVKTIMATRPDHFAKAGRIGGRVKTAKGFSKSGLAQEAGRKGGGARRIYLDESLGGIKKMLELKDQGATYEEIGTYFGVNWWVIRARYVESVDKSLN